MDDLPSYEWWDITDICKKASNLLSYSEPMITDSNFSLFEAMSAVELMDPKMDQCCGFEGTLNIEDLLEFKIDPNMNLGVVLEFLQSLFICEIQFLDGASQLESIHQCVFAWSGSWKKLAEHDNLSTKIILGYCKSCVLSASVTLRAVINADVYEEEEFSCSTRCNPNEILSDDMNVIVEINNIIDSVQADVLQQAIPTDTAAVSVHSQIVAILQLRMSINRLFQSYESFISDSLKHTVKTTDSHVNKPDVADLQQHATECIQCIENIQKLQFTDLSSFTSNANVAFAFSPKMSQSLQITPVRQLTSFSFHSGLSYLSKVCTEIHSECSFIQKNIITPDSVAYHELLHYARTISSARQHILTRSMVWSAMHCIKHDFAGVLTRSMAAFNIPKSVVSFPLNQRWISSILKVLWDTLRAYMTHRYKLLGKLDIVFQHWGKLMHDSLGLDLHFQQENKIEGSKQHWFSAWALILVTSIMDTQMGLLIELDLLRTSELDYFYWYWDYILSTRILAMKTLRELASSLVIEVATSRRQEAEQGLHLLKMRSSMSQKEKASKRLEYQKIMEEPIPGAIPPSSDELISQARVAIFKGLFRVYIVLMKLKFIDKEENEYTSLEQLFAQRFRSFVYIDNPHPLSLEMFISMTNSEPNATPQDILSSASACFRNGKLYIDELRKTPLPSPATYSDQLARDQLVQLAKVNVASSVAVMKTLQGLQQFSIVTMSAAHESSRSEGSTLRLENGSGSGGGSGSGSGSGTSLKLVLDSSHNRQLVIPELRTA